MLLDPSKSEQDWLAALTDAAERAFGLDRAAAGQAALERLSHALAALAASGPELNIRARDSVDEGGEAGGERGRAL